ncbi:hypothetical protein TNCV_651331 [Trichonephila clavipes]|nr:hypothetical protein TNCV_651331 [Trichonephila clavipes]
MPPEGIELRSPWTVKQRCHRRQYEQLSVLEGKNHRGGGNWVVARRASRHPGRSDYCEERCWDQRIRKRSITRRRRSGRPRQSRRLKHHRTRAHSANCLIVRHPYTSSIFTMDLCVSPYRSRQKKD